MSMISEHLKSEIIDPTLPRDSFVPPDAVDGLGDDGDIDDLVGGQIDGGEYDDE